MAEEQSITARAIRAEITPFGVVVAVGALLAYWWNLRSGAADPSGGGLLFWLGLFGPCVFSALLAVELWWHHTGAGEIGRWVIRSFVLTPGLIAIATVLGVPALSGVADLGHRTSPDEYSGPTRWLVDQLVLGAIINLAVCLMVAIATLLLVVLPRVLLAARDELKESDPTVTEAQLNAGLFGGFLFIGVVSMAFVVPTLLVVANDQSGATQVVLRVVGIALGVVGLVGAFVIRFAKKTGASDSAG